MAKLLQSNHSKPGSNFSQAACIEYCGINRSNDTQSTKLINKNKLDVCPTTDKEILLFILIPSFDCLKPTHNFCFFNLNAFTITETELKLIAAAAMTGDNKIPKNGYKTPAATGTPSEL